MLVFPTPDSPKTFFPQWRCHREFFCGWWEDASGECVQRGGCKKKKKTMAMRRTDYFMTIHVFSVQLFECFFVLLLLLLL
jgi:hypothetical protein